METAARREATIERKTLETAIRLRLVIDGEGTWRGRTGIGFFDHLLSAFARHGLFDLEAEVSGDLEVDGHHTVEDTGLCLGRALRTALGDKAGIRRMGSAFVPMDEALVHVAVDVSGRPFLACNLSWSGPSIGALDTALVTEFLRAVAVEGGLTLHVRQLAGENDHHVAEAAFKALGRALDEACGRDPRVKGVPSTKGVL
ncbi:MAG TPA: imidazoleglycerol-phosphate dehydratase HisB [Limnochordia bacterium]